MLTDECQLHMRLLIAAVLKGRCAMTFHFTNHFSATSIRDGATRMTSFELRRSGRLRQVCFLCEGQSRCIPTALPALLRRGIKHLDIALLSIRVGNPHCV